MKSRIVVIVFTLLVSVTSFAGEVYLPIVGSVGTFSTDVRVFNPSFTDDIEIDAYLLAIGNSG